MMGSYHIFAALILLVVLVAEGLALQCYECNSKKEQDCETDPKSRPKFLTDCGENATSCRKIEQEIFYDADYHVRTIRQCAYDSGPLKCVERTGTYRFKVHYCHCADNLCNTASSLSFSVTFALVLAGISAAATSVLKL